MAITTLEFDTVNNAAALCHMILGELYPKLQGLQQIFDAEGGVGDTLTQADLDEISTFSGLTVQQVQDAIYPLTATILPAITAAYGQMAQLAARDRGYAPPPPMPLTPPAMLASPPPAVEG